MLFDTHTHSYFDELLEKQDEIIAEMQKNDIRYATQIGCDLESSKKAIKFAKAYEPYFATVGFHPTEGQDFTDEKIKQAGRDIEMLIISDREHIVGLGEIGFDYFHLNPDTEAQQKEAQRKLFFTMAELAIKHDLPAIIHTRNAREDTTRYIKESGLKKCVIHCFSEDLAFAEELMRYSDEIYFSFSGIVTYPKSSTVQEAATRLPLDRILIETDAPFLSPQPVRGTTNTPANVRYVLETIKNLRDEDTTEVEKRIFENSLRFYGVENTI